MLPVSVLLMIVSAPPLKMPAPRPAVFPLILQFIIVTVAPSSLSTPPPAVPAPRRIRLRCDRDARRERPLHHRQSRRREHLGLQARGAGRPVVRPDAAGRRPAQGARTLPARAVRRDR